MKIFLLVSLLGTALASPGGLGYSSYSTAYGPLARSALAYGGFASTGFAAAPVTGYAAEGAVVAAAPVAAYGAAPAYSAAPAYAAAPVASYAAPAVASYAAPAVAAYAAAPAVTAYSAPAIAAAPVAAVSAAPATAVVPVTRVSAQPAVVQNVVDVAQPKLATRRFEIRRPAIQKQFYDIEERVVVRPAGSAVVELETPIGANQRGQTKISPAAPPVALHSYSSTHLATPIAPSVLPAVPAFPVHSYPHYPEVVEQNQERPQEPEPVQQLPPQTPQLPISQPSFPTQDLSEQQSDDSDSVSVENPEISARISRPPAPQNLPSPLFRAQLPAFPRAEAPLPSFPRSEAPLPQFSRSESPIFRGSLPEQFRPEGIPSFSRSRLAQYLEPEPLPPQQIRSQLPPLSRAQPTPRPEFSVPRQQEPDFSFVRSQLSAFSPRPVVSPRQGPTPQPLEAEFEARSFASESVIPSARNLSPEQSQANQARLIDLLTARGPVAEVRSASEPIRGRVLSATPAPPGAEPADERVNTRRVVVNRPIQTVQEVEVVEPFTKLERVAIHQPAVVKSAHVELAAVPAAVPAVHAAIPAVSAVHTAVPALHSAVTVAPHYYK